MQINSFNSKIFVETTIGPELAESVEALAPSQIFIISDENTHKYCVPHLEDLPGHIPVQEFLIGQGESAKGLDTVVTLWQHLQDKGADTGSLVLSVGGGMLLDVAGFAAATFKRGLRLIHMPTTLLAMVDASVGGKTGFNFNRYKNHIGAFHIPDYVLIYPRFLSSLDPRQLHAGWAEMIKHGLIQSRTHFEQLTLGPPGQRPLREMARLIRDSVDIKNYYVTTDPYESGVRKALNFGHTIGHALESLSVEKNTPLLHGEAIAFGLLCEYQLSMNHFGIEPGPYHQLREFVDLHYPGFPFMTGDLDRVFKYLDQDKKNKGEKINFTLLEEIGRPVVDQYAGRDEIEQVLKTLMPTND